MSKIVTPEKISEALSLYISKRVTKVGLTNSITEWLEQNPIEPAVVRRSTHPFARSQQFMPDWTNWVDKDGAYFWHE